MRNQLSSGVSYSFAVLSLLLIAVLPQPAAAKSLFESIFGFLGSSQQASQPPSTATRPQPAAPVMQHNGSRHTNPFGSQAPQAPAPRSYGGRYKTVCVRLCDGYYFPISNTSRRRDFYDDAQQCQSRCQSDVRLYYMSPSSGSIMQARDQRGMYYSDLKTAFLYRKKLSKSCQCRPEPWSVSERIRHKNYALVSQNLASDAAAENVAEAGTSVVAAQPQIVSEGGASAQAPQAWPRAPAPRPAYREAAERPRPMARGYTPPQPQAVRPVKKPSWGLGAAFGNSLPKVRYRHKWGTPD